MIQGVGQGGLAKAAIEAALASMQRGAKVEGALPRAGESLPGVSAPASGPSFSDALAQGISRAEAVRRAVDKFMNESVAEEPEFGFGLWKHKKLNTQAYVDSLRSEWGGR